MKKLIACASLTLLVGAGYAGCGTKIPVEGELSKNDEETKELTVGKSKVTPMASASIKDASGSRAKIEDLIGKMVVVSTDKHTKKGESVSVQADEGADEKKSSAADKPKEMKSSM